MDSKEIGHFNLFHIEPIPNYTMNQRHLSLDALQKELKVLDKKILITIGKDGEL